MTTKSRKTRRKNIVSREGAKSQRKDERKQRFTAEHAEAAEKFHYKQKIKLATEVILRLSYASLRAGRGTQRKIKNVTTKFTKGTKDTKILDGMV